MTDGAGGAVVAGVWNNGSDKDIIANRVVDTGNGVWGWGYGVVVGGAGVPGDQDNQMMTSDGHGGAFIAWEDTRYDPSKDICANWVTSTGETQWGTAPGFGDGVVVCDAAGKQSDAQVVPDASSGAIIAWAAVIGGPPSATSTRTGSTCREPSSGTAPAAERSAGQARSLSPG